ncbi:MAG: CPBP family intramembrane glutamic endopeptidase [Cyanobacteria bacterium J06623_7]
MSKKSALISLVLFVPAFSIGVAMSLFIAPGLVGNSIFTAVKIWGIVFPLLWVIKTKSTALRLPKFRRAEIKVGVILGLLMFGTILLAYNLIGQQAITLSEIRAKASEVGITNPYIYLAGCLYWSFVNSLIEELTWRSFVVSQCKILVSGTTAVILAALFFTAHHSLALYGYTHDWLVVTLGSLGVFGAGIIWSWCYSHYRSVVPGYISHILADLAIAIVGYQLLFV